MPVPPTYPYYLGYEWADRYRAERITDLIREEAGKLDQKYFMRIQNDVYVLAADKFVPLLIDASKNASKYGITLDKDEAEAFQILINWNREAVPSEAGPTIFDSWIRELKRTVSSNVFKGKPEETLLLEMVEWLITKKDEKLLGGSPQKILLETFKQSVSKLKDRLGGSPSEWLWGRIHKYNIQHVVGSVLSWMNYPKKPAKGWGTTVNPGSGYLVDSGASWREIYVFNGSCYSVIPGGQSGWRFSPHWSDQLQMWINGEYKEFKMPGNPDQLGEWEAKIVVVGG